MAKTARELIEDIREAVKLLDANVPLVSSLYYHLFSTVRSSLVEILAALDAEQKDKERIRAECPKCGYVFKVIRLQALKEKT